VAKKRFRTPHLREHIHAATAVAVAAAGYEQTSVQAICAIAEISPETFAGQFTGGKPEAVVGAVEEAFEQAMTDCQAAFEAAASWPEGVWAVICVLTDWCASEPAFAKLGLFEIKKADLGATKLADSMMDTLCLFLEPGYDLAGERLVPMLSLDGSIQSLERKISADICAIVQKHLLREPPQTLPAIVPELARTALAPFLGPEATERFVAEQLAKGEE
jgi:AcrR family transcriptional regulator